MSSLEPSAQGHDEEAQGEGSERGRSPTMQIPQPDTQQTRSASRPPTSAEIDAVIAAAIANAPPPPPPQPEYVSDNMTRSVTPLMTNLLPSAVGIDGRVNLFVGNLPYRVRWQDLKDLFRKAGTVLRADVSLGPDNRSRGYGTVLMGSREDAARAIDRYNGYTWQTRTLEVRPDRLPPEYEAQSHQPHQRNGPYGFQLAPGVNHPSYPVSGHLTPSGGPGWLPGQRPPFGLPQAPGASHGLLGVPGLGTSPGAPPMSVNGSSPIPSAQSPGSIYAALPLPLSVQNTGGHPYPQLAASPLAGSLSAGTTSVPIPSNNMVRRDSLTPFAHSVSPDLAPRSTSPVPGGSSRPNSSGAKPRSHGSPAKDGHANRAAPPGSLGPLPPPLFANVNSPKDAAPGPSEVPGISPPGGRVHGKASTGSITGMEGLAHQGMGLGPPNTLHDRVIFVSNLPLAMQWQDLKDLLRPAGTIIRADIAIDDKGRPRGFGTALFASEADASRAVNMFNERDIAGFRIRAHLERDRYTDNMYRSQSAGSNAPDMAFQSPTKHAPTKQANGFRGATQDFEAEEPHVPPIDTSTPVAPSRTSAPPDSSPVAKLPWSLNTSLHNHQTPGRPNFRQNHHPGPISMPSFPPLDHGNPMSPQTRGLPPMTPSMPGFVFNAYPETPPIHPHFMSPGIGPFSPGIPVTSPTAFQYNPFLNAAPGAPVNRYPQGGSAQLGTPTTQAFPNPSSGAVGGPGMNYQYAGAPGPPNISQTLDYFPNILPHQQPQLAPDSPTPRIPRPPPSASPLNAKDRLAPAAQTSNGASAGGPEVDLSTLTSTLTLKDEEDGAATPPSPSEAARPFKGSQLKDFKAVHGLGVPHPATATGSGGRASLDESRTFGLPQEQEVERRASFSAAPGAGR